MSANPHKIEARFDWNTNINQSDPLGLFVPNAGGATVLKMNGVVSSPIAQPSATTFTATASVVNFKVNLFGFVTIWFDRLQFEAKSGSKPDVAVDLHPGDDAIAFGGLVEEEGTVRLAATTSSDQASNQDLVWLHETVVAWTGWSLCAPPPGKTIMIRSQQRRTGGWCLLNTLSWLPSAMFCRPLRAACTI